jgi:peptide/nickel transport system ATP-binding protein
VFHIYAYLGCWIVGASPATPKTLDSVATKPLLRVRNLAVCIRADANHRIRLLEGIDLDVCVGETVGLLGESGAGKTTLAMAILGLLPASNWVVEGSIEFEGVPLLHLRDNELRKIRGSRISLVHQDSSVLNPALRVGDQIVEVLRAHRTWKRQRYRDEALRLLQEVEMGDAERIYTAFPHQLSGGERQRIALAQALACQPALVIADEPTASLDSNTTAQILKLIGRLKRRFHTAFVVISHDYSILTDLSDRFMIMYSGRIVEQGFRGEVLQGPLHPYVSALFGCGLPLQMPNDREVGKSRMLTIAGGPPDPSRRTRGCDFENRCPDRMNVCRTRVPEEMHISNGHTVRCFKFGG